MASKSDKTQRIVVPQWKEYREFATSGELLGHASDAANVVYFPIDKYIGRWQLNPSMATAGDLLSAAIMNGQTSNPTVIKAAKYVIEREDYGYITLCKTARMILPKEENESIEKHPSDVSAKIKIINREEIYKERVGFLRKLINEYPYNALWYVELSRCYVNLGLVDKAEKYMKVAVHLAPNSRYVSRAAARMFLHSGDKERAHYVLTHNQAFLHDPWLIASEIAVNAANNRGSKFIKQGLSLIHSGNYSPFELTELASAIGTNELEYSLKKAKQLLNQSLIAPNANSWAQAEWLSDRYKSLGLAMMQQPELVKNYEGQAIAAFINNQYDVALDLSIDWISEMRFAKRPIYFATDMAYVYQERYQDAIRILQLGCKMNPKELEFKNNLAYAYALNNQVDEAEKELNELCGMLSGENPETLICAVATGGLIEFRKGHPKEGRQMYQMAIEAALGRREKELADKALLNLIREEFLADPKCDKSILAPLDKLSTGDKRETEAMKQRILKLVHE